MNYGKLLLLGLIFIATTSFAQKKVLYSELQEHHGKVYQVNTIPPFTGQGYEMWEKGKMKERVTFKDGILHGKAVEWDQAGKKVYEADFANGIQHGMMYEWYANGNPRIEVNFVRGSMQGILKQYHENGTLAFDGEFENGIAIGTHKWYHENGKVSSKGGFKNGVEEGLHEWWYENGEKEQEKNFEKGIVQGTVFTWHKNGNPELESEHVDGKEHGRTSEWYKNGQRMSEATFKMGVKDGEAKMWNNKGVLQEVLTYDNGEIINHLNYRSAGMRTYEGYIQIFNELKSFFTVEVKGEEVMSINATDIKFRVDRKILEMHNVSVGLITQGKKDMTEAEILEKFKDFEIEKIEEELGKKLTVEVLEKTNSKGQKYLYWSFKQPQEKKAEMQGRGIKEQVFAATICNEQILLLNSIVSNYNSPKGIEKLIEETMDNLEISSERIELNAFTKKLLRQ